MVEDKKRGRVYFLNTHFSSGDKEYVGSTTRPLRERLGEHQRAVDNHDTSKYVGRSQGFEVKGSFFSNNCRKAEQTIKRKKQSSW